MICSISHEEHELLDADDAVKQFIERCTKQRDGTENQFRKLQREAERVGSATDADDSATAETIDAVRRAADAARDAITKIEIDTVTRITQRGQLSHRGRQQHLAELKRAANDLQAVLKSLSDGFLSGSESAIELATIEMNARFQNDRHRLISTGAIHRNNIASFFDLYDETRSKRDMSEFATHLKDDVTRITTGRFF